MANSTVIIALLTPVLLLGGWLCWRWAQRTDLAITLSGRWLLTLVVFGLVFAGTKLATSQFAKIIVVLLTGGGAFLLMLLWWDFFAEQFGSLYTGGDRQLDPGPFSAIAQANRKKGRYQEAV